MYQKVFSLWVIIGKHLTHCHTMPHFDAKKIYSCGKHCEKPRNCLLQAISFFLTMFSTLYGIYSSFKMHFRMSSAICFNLNQSKILSSGNGLKWLTLYPMTHFEIEKWSAWVPTTLVHWSPGLFPQFVSLTLYRMNLFPQFVSLTLYRMKKTFNPLPNKKLFLHVYSTSLLKTLWEKGKLLVTSNFSFSHSVFYPFNPLFHKYSFWHINNRRLLKTLWEKEKLLINNLSFSHNVFY